jgi:hypothetical protein
MRNASARPKAAVAWGGARASSARRAGASACPFPKLSRLTPEQLARGAPGAGAARHSTPAEESVASRNASSCVRAGGVRLKPGAMRVRARTASEKRAEK